MAWNGLAGALRRSRVNLNSLFFAAGRLALAGWPMGRGWWGSRYRRWLLIWVFVLPDMINLPPPLSHTQKP
jgi:hypothetical protein